MLYKNINTRTLRKLLIVQMRLLFYLNTINYKKPTNYLIYASYLERRGHLISWVVSLLRILVNRVEFSLQGCRKIQKSVYKYYISTVFTKSSRFTLNVIVNQCTKVLFLGTIAGRKRNTTSIPLYIYISFIKIHVHYVIQTICFITRYVRCLCQALHQIIGKCRKVSEIDMVLP